MHRLVCIGDSIMQGFKNGAVFDTELSFPAIIAREMGLGDQQFVFPRFFGAGGLPLNIEYLLRRLDHEYGPDINLWEIPLALIDLRRWMDEAEDYWERGPGAGPLPYRGPYHNLAVWGSDIQDTWLLTADLCRRRLANPADNVVDQVPERPKPRTALRVLNPSHSDDPADQEATVLSRAQALARDDGIENLLIFLGANHVLGTVVKLQLRSSADSPGDLTEPDPERRRATLYTPEHFRRLLDELARRVEALNQDGGQVRRVFWGTVPPVTVPPVSRGVGGRMDSAAGRQSHYPGDYPQWYRRYFQCYTRPWIEDDAFDRRDDPYLSGVTVMDIDAVIMAYKAHLQAVVAVHNDRRRRAGEAEDWFIVDTHRTLERLAFRRYREDPSVPRPPGLPDYDLPPSYKALGLDTRFLQSHRGQRVSGGLFSLDGVHPTTAGYGIVAQEYIDAMRAAGVPFFHRDGITPRADPVKVDYPRLLRMDTLAARLPEVMDDLWHKLAVGDEVMDLFARVLRVL